jgi:DNA-binding CsgD family transcriptional regulator
MINSNVTNIKNIRKDKIPYMLTWSIFYAILITFFTWWINKFDDSLLFDKNIIVSINILMLFLGAFLLFIIKPNKFKNYIKFASISGIVLLLIYGIYLFFNNFIIGKYLFILISISIAFISVGTLSAFIYILNNTEKLYSCLFSNIFISSYAIVESTFGLNKFISYLILLVSFILIFFQSKKMTENDYKEEELKYEKNAPKIKKILYVSIIINCIFLIFCRGTGRALLLIVNDLYPENIEIYYNIGGLLGSLILFIIYKFAKKSNSLTWNLIFGSYIFSMFLGILSDKKIVLSIYSFTLGLTITMGITCMYYILGVISKKYWNYAYVKYNILIIAILGSGVGSLFGNAIYKINDPTLNEIVIITSFLLMLILLMISPFFAATFYSHKWDEDSTKANIDNLNLRKFMKYNLTNKEIEVCNHLLKNESVRQIAISMNISENTVKFHKKQIFDKLKISSKEEIFKFLK